MWRYRIDEHHMLGFLHSGKLDQDLDELFENFWDFSQQFQFQLVKYIKTKKVYPSVKVIKKVFEVKEESARTFLREGFKEFSFPTVREDGAELVEGIVIPKISETITNVKEIKRYLKPLREFLGFGFAVFFNKGFSGKSFQLPLLLSLYLENFPEKTLFTGGVDGEGRIREVDGIPKKRRLAEELGWHFVQPSNLRDVRDIKEWYDRKTYKVPFYITKTSDRFEGEWESFISSANLKGELEGLSIFHGIGKDGLLVVTGQLKDNWNQTLREIYSGFKEVETKLKGKERFHIAINGASALAFGVGALFGSQKPFVFYHMQNGVYNPIEVDNVREIKERVEEFRQIEYKLSEGGSKLVVILSLSHHELEQDVRRYVSFLENPSFLVVRYAKAGNIAIEHMKELSKEVAGLLQRVRKEKFLEEFHFFFSCPVSVAFMLGVAFGHYSQGMVYNYQKEGSLYMPVFELSLIRGLREGVYEEVNL